MEEFFGFVFKFWGNIMPVQDVSLAGWKIKVLCSCAAYMPKLRHLSYPIVLLTLNNSCQFQPGRKQLSAHVHPSFVESDRQGDIVMMHYRWWSCKELNKQSISILSSSQTTFLKKVISSCPLKDWEPCNFKDRFSNFRID